MTIANVNFFKTVSSILEKLGIETNSLSGDTCLEANLGMDSQEVVEFQVALEKQYRVRFPAGFLNRDLSIHDLTKKLQDLTALHNS
jgi:acyl carrier protein